MFLRINQSWDRFGKNYYNYVYLLLLYFNKDAFFLDKISDRMENMIMKIQPIHNL